MISGVLAVSASNFTPISSPTSAPTTFPKGSATREDTVQLSDQAQQHVASSASTTPSTQGMVKQLVLAAAAGDEAALSLLMIA
jgi:hypothetical protein